MKLLQIDSSILGGYSASRVLTAAIVAHYRAQNPDLDVVYHDVAAEPLGHLTSAWLPGRSTELPEDPVARKDAELSQYALKEFLSADVLVIGAPMYNLGIPSQLKTWLDRIIVAGQTFRYGPNGVEGLAAGKKLILAVSRGGVYSKGSPAAVLEHQESYLKAVFGFMGITDVTVIEAEGLAANGGADRARILEDAQRQIAAL
ncbi:FMN-dependent NADH-azoreductase [Gluconobacter wancherniae]|uniref:FMN-dependent NADH-azoreductase n=1 Tax=Gluconobacter wancherniae TaxID=1307955 RepID=UPI0030A9930B